ncbi:NAD(P)/FAD-dependent oxidoreductase [Streptomyces sp. HNM0645]|uniref:NAD(P)/FAD-dependent oxidoreductase n=1 Tax=Streptomyces sp. HNM0645 TaxID=2782343 RepID=UPI0024B78ED5|nr:NAD(P)/FAD-dependent oxidoreductase [Streptomyces sp. HNM0645]MDI9884467.1 NAD(P)/FAD-dependent oxidoreductase [Streptomyces sp. HNM0645]
MKRPHGTHTDVIVVGAGLAGLTCALDLTAAGLSVAVLEASDAVGGRMRTDRYQGFLLDRGFQVFNTSYPQVKRRLRLADLRLRPFTPGVLVHTPKGRIRFGDPTRRPRDAAALVTGRRVPARDLLALGALTARDTLLPPRVLKGLPERTTLTELSRAGVSEEVVDGLVRPFLAGVFLEDELRTTSRMFHLVWRSFVRGSMTLPAAGIGAVPAQLAGGLPAGTVETGTPVSAVTDGGVTLADGSVRTAPSVVVATDAATASALVPRTDPPRTRTVTTYHHAAAAPPLGEPTLLLDAAGRFLNTAVLSEVVPGYAPDGRALLSTSVLGADAPGREESLRDVLAEVYGTETGGWELLAARTVRGALPAMDPPWPLSRTTRIADGLHVCGDHRATGSVQGAMASGTRAAREVLAGRAR